MIAKRIKEKLHIEIDYVPNDYINKEDWELNIFLNGNKINTISNFSLIKKDLCFNEIFEEAKTSVKNELWGKHVNL